MDVYDQNIVDNKQLYQMAHKHHMKNNELWQQPLNKQHKGMCHLVLGFSLHSSDEVVLLAKKDEFPNISVLFQHKGFLLQKEGREKGEPVVWSGSGVSRSSSNRLDTRHRKLKEGEGETEFSPGSNSSTQTKTHE